MGPSVSQILSPSRPPLWTTTCALAVCWCLHPWESSSLTLVCLGANRASFLKCFGLTNSFYSSWNTRHPCLWGAISGFPVSPQVWVHTFTVYSTNTDWVLPCARHCSSWWGHSRKLCPNTALCWEVCVLTHNPAVSPGGQSCLSLCWSSAIVCWEQIWLCHFSCFSLLPFLLWLYSLSQVQKQEIEFHNYKISG